MKYLFQLCIASLFFMSALPFVYAEELYGAGCPKTGPYRSACQVNRDDETEDWLLAPLQALPFELKLPHGWSMDESNPSYRFFKDGARRGYVLIHKVPSVDKDMPEASLVFDRDLSLYCQAPFCWIKSSTFKGYYKLEIHSKGPDGSMVAQEKAQILVWLRTMKLDLEPESL